MSRRKIDEAKEIRLWLGQVILPVIGVLIAVPKSRNWLKSKFESIRERADKQRKDWGL